MKSQTHIFIALILVLFANFSSARDLPSAAKKLEVLMLLSQQDNIDNLTRQHYQQEINDLKQQQASNTIKGGGTASFHGTIVDASSNPVANIEVQLTLINAGVAGSSSHAWTDGTGVFSFTALAAGNYSIRVMGSSQGYLSYAFRESVNGGIIECYYCGLSSDQYISLAAGETRNGIDFTVALGGVISGTVTDATSTAAVDTFWVYAVSGNARFSTYIDASGNYTFQGLPDGNYRIYLDPLYYNVTTPNMHIPQIYGGVECNACYRRLLDASTGTTLTIASANTINNIDFSLNIGASISGRLVDAITLDPLHVYNYIYIVNENNESVGALIFEGTDTNATETGDYTVAGLLPGSYYVQGGDLGREYYMRELYANKPCYWSGCDRANVGDTVTLSANENKVGINFLLEKGGKIEGTLTDALSGLPLNINFNNAVQFYDASENVIGGGYYESTVPGVYHSGRAIPAGTYSVRTGSMFNGKFNYPYVDEKYNGIACPGVSCDLSSTNVVVTTESTTTGIDFALSQGQSFSGTITDTATSAPIANVYVLVYKDMGAGLEPKFASWATTSDGSDGSAVGTFTVEGLVAGTYYAVTNNGSKLPFIGIYPLPGAGWIDILYNGIPCPAVGCDITLGTPIVIPVLKRGGANNTVDFSLSQGASFAGTIRNFDDNAPIKNVYVNIFNDQAVLLGSFPANTQGEYHTAGYAAGTYYLTTSSHVALVDVKYGNENCAINNCNPLDATPITLTTGQSASSIDFSLKPDYMFGNAFE